MAVACLLKLLSDYHPFRRVADYTLLAVYVSVCPSLYVIISCEQKSPKVHHIFHQTRTHSLVMGDLRMIRFWLLTPWSVIEVNGEKLEQVSGYKCMGSWVTEDGKSEKEGEG